MSKKKRALSLILCFVMVFSLLTVIPATSVTPEASAAAYTGSDRTGATNMITLEGHETPATTDSNDWGKAKSNGTYYMAPGDSVNLQANSRRDTAYWEIRSGNCGSLTTYTSGSDKNATFTASSVGTVVIGVRVINKVGLTYYHFGTVTIKVVDKCTLSYNLNGGSGTFDSVDKFKGNTVTISSSKPSFTGYTFQYWQGSDGKTYQPGKSATLNSNLKLTAVWKQNDYNPTLLRDVLSTAYNNDTDDTDENEIKYSVKTLNVNLFDYDADVFNGYYMNHNTTPAQDFFQFRGGESIFFSTLSDGIGEGIHYSKNTVAKQNILNSTLTNNLPTMRYGLNVDLFDPNDSTVKTVYKDVSMEFIQYGNCYYYSSYLNHMQLNSAGNALELYADNLSLGMSDTDENYNVGNFWPFSNISYSLDNSAGVVSGVSTVPGYAECSGSGEAKAENYISGWSEYVGQITTPIYANRAMETTTEGNLTNHHFGLSMETQFYMPNSRTVDGTSTGDGMKFEFSGDDDLWVFIDDYLVLDIGGGHKALYGYIDFKNDEVYVSNAVTVTGANTNAGDEGPKTKKISDINSSLLDGGMHYMRIFYLERHGGASNCCIKFNLPVVPIPSVTVQNQVADQSGELLSSESDIFTYYLQDENGTGLVNKTYTVGNAEFKTGTGGKFTLTANQFATFTDIGPNTNVKVVQDQPTNVTNPAKYDGVKIDFIGDTTEYGTKGTNYTSGTYLMGEGSVNRYVFTNYVKEYDLSTSGEHAILTPASEHYVYDASNKTEVSIAPESGYIITAITVDGTAYNTAQVVAAAKAGKITVDHMSSHSINVVAEKSDTDKITVIDFGLPVKVSGLYDVVGLSATAPSVATITGGTDSCEFTANTVELSYGKASIDAENNKNVDYTPTAVLQSKDTFYTAYKAATGFRYTQVDIIPAADVYYEDSFVSYEGAWTSVG
ncbi:MAG: fibro-slime domain-containing protein, partial [Oscillospiraceae bacterium]